ncbi:alpha/beta hydrolase [Alkalicoccus urumqiensis]|uniref:Phospholipase n=1 Tax=Alkalicoccus urumqiensis TaxID=1548213 RepID=A0A2P6MGF7_ALKUR|nr:alpha/beta hydrolase [Alkalicoccus urumqiensis]PRO65353.1 phospholipase [Alkalicoccus urumqiensis]
MWLWRSTVQSPKGVIVLVHGAGEYHGRYEKTNQLLNEHGYHIIMGDLPGQGTTAGPRGHIDSFSQYVREVTSWMREAFQFDLPVILMGHSMGGLAAQETLHSLPDHLQPEVMLLSSPCFGLATSQPRWRRTLAGMLSRTAPKTMFPNGLEPGSGTRDETMRQRDEADDLLVKKVSARWYTELLKAMKRAHETAPALPDVPVYVTQGGDDRIVDKQEVRRWFDALRVSEKAYKEWPDAYHEVLNEPERRQVADHLIGFLDVQLQLRRR